MVVIAETDGVCTCRHPPRVASGRTTCPGAASADLSSHSLPTVTRSPGSPFGTAGGGGKAGGAGGSRGAHRQRRPAPRSFSLQTTVGAVCDGRWIPGWELRRVTLGGRERQLRCCLRLGTFLPSLTQHWMELLNVSKTGPQFPAPASEENHQELGEE